MPVDQAPAAFGVRVLAFPEVDDLDLMGAYAVLSKAAEIAEGRPPRWDVAIAGCQPELRTAGGLRFQAQAGLDEGRRPDAVLVPGGRGIQRILTSAPYLEYLRAAHRHGAAVYSVCSGALLVAASGIAAGATLAIHAAKRADLARAGDCTPGAGLVLNAGLTSVGGDRRSSVKSVDLALQLVADHGAGLLPELLARMELSQGRTLETATPEQP
ncbi:MAG TPA: DJ-1/PfpI family protein [Jatrophihabitans sp.]|jgi:transcriptional regulator GlxA family with amidase domain|uniref:DJ-1/PfpI family protein n=1 Tax=Jatrophihabitans sp. TaxID=1932789 RepID=UPI002F244A7A